MSNIWVPWNSQVALALRSPELLVPGGKPYGSVKINPAHPLARGLRHFIPFIPGQPLRDLVSGAQRTNAQGQYLGDLYDLGASESIEFTQGDLYMGSTEPHSWAMLVETDQAASTNPGCWTIAQSLGSSALGPRCLLGSGVYGPMTVGMRDAVGATHYNYHWPNATFGTSIAGLNFWGATNNGTAGDYTGVRVFKNELDAPADAGSSLTFVTATSLGRSNATKYLDGRFKYWVVWSRELAAAEMHEFRRNPFAPYDIPLLIPANDAPFLISVPAGGGAAYDETFAVSAASAVTLTDAWSLNYSEAYSTSAAASLALSDSYATGYAETYTASATAALALTDAWLLEFAETYGANASGDLALTDGWSLDYSEAYAVGAAADLALADAWALDYAETLTVTATGDLALSNAYAVGNNYDESFSVAAVAELSLTDVWAPHYGETLASDATAALALTDTWQLDYAETLAASAAAEVLLSDAYDSPAPGAYDEMFSASAIASLDLTHLFTTPNALPAGINHLTARRVGGFFAVKP